jgi:type VI secretion system ImpC/EvpB family protein
MSSASPKPVQTKTLEVNDLIAEALAVSGAGPESTSQADWIDDFLAAQKPGDALSVWLNAAGIATGDRDKGRVSRLLNHQAAKIDDLLTEQLNAVMHHERFQALEAAWRGLWYLVERAEEANDRAAEADQDVKTIIRVLNINKRELFKDLTGAIEFDQSTLFRKIYESEFGTAGGTPYGLLVGDYALTSHIEDIELLERMSEVAAASFAPFITAAAPSLLGIEDYSWLARPIELGSTFQRPEMLKWRALRDREDSQFLGLVVPRMRLRLPYRDDGSCQPGFRFAEQTGGPDTSGYLWCNAAFGFAAVAIRAFGECGWFADIRGREPLTGGGGRVEGLPELFTSTERYGLIPRSPTDTAMADTIEKELTDLGFIPLISEPGSLDAVFYSNSSVHKPKVYDDASASANARLSAMLQYVLCASRFAHYIKVLARDKIGSMASARDLELELHKWVVNYVTPDEKAAAHVKAERPLRAAEVEIRDEPGRPGRYNMVLKLLPHYQLDQLTVSLKMVTRLVAPGKG